VTNILKLHHDDIALDLAQNIPATGRVQQARLEEIDPNPFRDLKMTPLMEDKVQALASHYSQHGSFPATPVARKEGNRLQLAYGHHTLEAARQLKLLSMNVEIKELADKQMIGLMPTEHGESGKRDFFVCLVSWMAAVKQAKTEEERIPTAIARQFGWVRPDQRRPDSPRLDNVASACPACAEVILAGRVELHWFKKKACSRAHAEANRIRSKKNGGGFLSPYGYESDKSQTELGFENVKIVDTKAPIHNFKRPLQFEAGYDIDIVEPEFSNLLTQIDRLISKNNPIDPIMNHLRDFQNSFRYLDAELKIDMASRLNEALDRLALRAHQQKASTGVEVNYEDE